MEEDFIIKRWGSPESYFEELETFLETHEKADCQTFDSNKNLVGVTYYFGPYLVAKEHIELMERIAEANKPEPGKEGRE